MLELSFQQKPLPTKHATTRYYVTAKERREREESTVELGVIGTGRNFNALRDVLSPELNTPADDHSADTTGGVGDGGGFHEK